MTATLSTYAETQQPIPESVETPVVETPTDTSGLIETPASILPETPVVETPTDTPELTDEQISSTSFSLDGGNDTPATETPVATTPQPIFNLDEEIKKIPKAELLKKLGVTDFAIELDEHLSKGGKASDYLGARSINYNEVSDDFLLKEDLKRQYPSATPKQIELLYERKYSISEDSAEEDREIAELEMKNTASNLRQQKIQEQAKFKVPETPIYQTDEAYEQYKASVAQQEQLQQQILNYYNEHAATKALNESKRVAINLGEGVAPFNFNIDKPELITRTFTDATSYQKLMTTNTGEPDVAKQQLVTLFAYNPQKFMQDIFNYGKTIANRSKVAEGQNAKKPDAVVSQIASVTPTYRTSTYGN